MAIYSVSYDLYQSREYHEFHERLAAYEHCWAMQGQCLVRTPESATELRRGLMALIDYHDVLFVCRVGEDWSGVGTQCGGWLDRWLPRVCH
ncbi:MULTISPECIES: hypothetical protein [Modicisalibacter]|uniref:hypothetical protein n=1 Tax=Modicisalibacter TaxID=574347 RepID=UPI00100C12B7|nr:MULTISPECIES: hypothetical protein [Halomonadaceae]MBZ9560392.1 hypothetical protein [Modicisalibacter sp. R2A 31.J]MBZ9576301.1 hypothetical protein [Modicisalibacter sp. MOD 31.J]